MAEKCFKLQIGRIFSPLNLSLFFIFSKKAAANPDFIPFCRGFYFKLKYYLSPRYSVSLNASILFSLYGNIRIRLYNPL